MSLTGGTRLGPYEVLSPLGAGGMGEVYKARDTRLERTVAIKVLPRHLSESSEVRQRFEREAKTISQLSHPHICALYDVGREGEVEYLVMELLEGETLTDHLAKGPLPLEQTLKFGVEIADALDKAHRHGIVHRDLKPGNVMLTKSGVKLLDFGLGDRRQAPTGTAADAGGARPVRSSGGRRARHRPSRHRRRDDAPRLPGSTGLHRDPFDRILVAQALLGGLVLLHPGRSTAPIRGADSLVTGHGRPDSPGIRAQSWPIGLRRGLQHVACEGRVELR